MHEYGSVSQYIQSSAAFTCDLRAQLYAAQASLWLVVSAVASVLLGIVFLQLFKHQPQLMTKATIASQVLFTLQKSSQHIPVLHPISTLLFPPCICSQ